MPELILLGGLCLGILLVVLFILAFNFATGELAKESQHRRDLEMLRAKARWEQPNETDDAESDERFQA